MLRFAQYEPRQPKIRNPVRAYEFLIGYGTDCHEWFMSILTKNIGGNEYFSIDAKNWNSDIITEEEFLEVANDSFEEYLGDLRRQPEQASWHNWSYRTDGEVTEEDDVDVLIPQLLRYFTRD